jgi:hypothetical protein
VTWADVAVAGAFVLGLAGGAIATIRVMRHVLSYLQREETKRNEAHRRRE